MANAHANHTRGKDFHKLRNAHGLNRQNSLRSNQSDSADDDLPIGQLYKSSRSMKGGKRKQLHKTSVKRRSARIQHLDCASSQSKASNGRMKIPPHETVAVSTHVVNQNVDDPKIGGLPKKGSVLLSDVFDVASDIAPINDNFIAGSADENITDGSNILMADTHNNMKEFELLSHDIATKMIDMLIADNQSDLFFSNKLKQVEFLHENIIPQRNYFLDIAKQFDDAIVFIDLNKASHSISKLVNDNFDFITDNQESKSSDRELWGGVVMIWGIIHAMEVNRHHLLEFQKVIPPTNDIEQFYQSVHPAFERATNLLSTTSVDSGDKLQVTSKRITKIPEVVCHHNTSKKNVVIDGRPYKCNHVTVIGDPVKSYTKYFSCMMVLDKTDGYKWKPSNEMSKTVKKNKMMTDTADRCEGTLICKFATKNGKKTEQYLPGTKAHTCYNRTSAMGDENPETRVPLLLIVPSPSWNVNRLILDSMKVTLANIPAKWWVSQKSCGTARQYLKELSSAPSLKMVRNQATSILGIYMKNFVTKLYPTLTHLKVGALRSRGIDSQFHLQGLMHRDYLEHVNMKVPDERPQSIIVALDPFNLLYEYYEYDESSEECATVLAVETGQAVLFSSSLRHAGGSNTKNKEDTGYKYRLFAYIASEYGDFPEEISTRLNINE
jgi:hypothetical protein